MDSIRVVYPQEDIEAVASPAWSTTSSPRDYYQAAPLKAPLLKAYPKLGFEHEEEERFGAALLARLGLSSRWAFPLVVLLAMTVGVTLGAGVSVAVLKIRASWEQNAPAPKSPWRWPIAPDAKWIPDLEAEGAQGEQRMFTVDGRAYWVYKPAKAAAGPLPAVVVLHGSDDTAQNIAKTTRFERLADMAEGGFLVVLPEMRIAGGETWDYVDDEPFFRSMLEMIDAEYGLDRKKVFTVGHSNGGTMALYLQNNMPEVFAAAASVEAGVGHLYEWTNTSFGRPAMIVWNHNDQVLAEFGGEKLYWQTIDKLLRHRPTSQVDEFTHEEPLPTGSWRPDDNEVVYASRKVWPAVGAQPELQVISWASHTPSHNWLNPRLVPGATLDASVLVWEFFNSVGDRANAAA